MKKKLTLERFRSLVHEDPDLEILEENKNHCLVGCPSQKICSKVEYNQLEKNNWLSMRNVLIGKLHPKILVHMTRVVGYYSKTENWNVSKLGELKDRRKGDYIIK